MISQLITLPHGYKARVESDDCPSNPWTDWDCEPPILTASLEHRGVFTNDHGTGLCLGDLILEIPGHKLGPKGRAKLLDAMRREPEDFHRYLDNPRRANGEDWQNAIREDLPELPRYWREAQEYMDAMEVACELAGIPCKRDTSNGYSQGDSALVFVAATPEWQKKVGWNPKTPQDKLAHLQACIELYGAWAWGDVYGLHTLFRADGTEVDDASCWGFYGSDHEKSGLLEHARSCIEYDLRQIEIEKAAAFEAACRDIETVA